MSFLKSFKADLLSSKNLSELSSKLHLAIISVLIIQTIPIIIYRYFNYPIIITYINLLELMIYTVSIILYFFKKPKLSLFFTAFGIPILYFYFTFVNPISDIERSFKLSFWFLLCFTLFYTFLIRTNKRRFIYLIFVFGLYFIPGSILGYNYPGNLIKIIQFLTLAIIPMIISLFIEKQDARIIALNDSLRDRLAEKETLTKSIKEKNKDLITFSHIMSHDLKTPIRSINAFTQLLKKNNKFEDEKSQEYVKFIEHSTDSMKILIEDLLIYYNVENEAIDFDTVDLQMLMTQIKKSYKFELDNARFKFHVDKLPEITGDKNLLKTLFRNLISNSIKYQPKDKVGHVPTIKVRATEKHDSVSVFIEDNGIGIDEKYAEVLFEPFKRYHNQEDYSGTGLGMSICKRVVEKHDGRIQVLNTSTNGTTIKLEFPKTVLAQ